MCLALPTFSFWCFEFFLPFLLFFSPLGTAVVFFTLKKENPFFFLHPHVRLYVRFQHACWRCCGLMPLLKNRVGHKTKHAQKSSNEIREDLQRWNRVRGSHSQMNVEVGFPLTFAESYFIEGIKRIRKPVRAFSCRSRNICVYICFFFYACFYAITSQYHELRWQWLKPFILSPMAAFATDTLFTL